MAEKKITEPKTIPFRGGQDKFIEPALLPMGAYSTVQNMRQMGLGMKVRLGMIKAHTTADETNKILTLFQFSKGKRTERHFYAQMSDGDVLEATIAPPEVTTGAFGAEVFSGSASSIPASWSVLNDKLLFSDGVDQHQICAGTDDYIDKFIAYSSASALPNVPTVGADYTDQVNDINTATVAVLDALGTNATDCVAICSQIQANRIYFGMTANVNTASSVLAVYYVSSTTGTWAAVSGFSDGTIASTGKSLGQSGYVTWTQPTDAIPKYMYNQNGFWLKIVFSAAISATVRCHTCTFGSGFTALQDVWDGDLAEAIEAQLTHTNVYTLGTNAITIGGMTSSDTLVFNTADPAEKIYIDVGSTPNTNSAVMTFKFLNTAGTWTTISGITDGTIGVAGKTLSQSGFVTLGRQADIKPQQYNSLPYQSYFYQVTVNATLSGSALTDINIGIQYVPYFDISTFGIGICSTAWKNRGVYVFDQDPAHLVISADGQPQVLSGADSAIYKVGDGRSNKIVAIKKFFNELIVAQEEKGTDGGCITLIQGTTPANLGKIILSNEHGCMNSRCLRVIDGLNMGGTEHQTVAFILSRRGVFYTDGRPTQPIPNFQKIKNYFDPSFSECIRAGYESQMFLHYDSSFNVLIIGLVSGSSAMVCNKWLVYDLGILEFSEDVYDAHLACMTEVEAASGNIPTLQVGGGTADGFVYILNTGLNDVETEISAYVRMEFGGQGRFLHLGEAILRMKVQTSGSCTITPYLNAVVQTAINKAMTAESTSFPYMSGNQFELDVNGDIQPALDGGGLPFELDSGDIEPAATVTIRRHRFNLNLKGQHISLKFEHNTQSESFYLLDLGVMIEEYTEQ